MGTSENNKRIAKNTIMLYIRMLVTLIVSLYTSRVIIQALGEVDYGLRNVVGGVVVMFGFINTAMANATSRHLTFELGSGNKEKLKRTFQACVTIHMGIAILIFLLSETVGLWFFYNKMIIPAERLDAAFWVYQCSVAGSMMAIMNVPYMSSVISHEKMGAFAWMSISDVVFQLLIVYLLYIIPYDKLATIAVLGLIVNIINRLIYRIYCIVKFEECGRWHFFWDKPLYKELTNFAGWTLVGNLAVVLYSHGLNLLLNVFFGPSVNAANAVASRVRSLVVRFSHGFQTALNPQITKTYAAGDLSYMHNLIYASSKYSAFLLYFLSLPIMVEAGQIIDLWLGIVPRYTVFFIRLSFFSAIVDGISNPVIISSQATGKVKWFQICVGCTLLSIVPVSYLVLKLGGDARSVYIVQFVIVLLAHAIRLYLIRPLINLHLSVYARKVVGRILPVYVVSFLPAYLVTCYLPQVWWRIPIVVAVSWTVMSAAMILWGLDSQERQFVATRISKVLKVKR